MPFNDDEKTIRHYHVWARYHQGEFRGCVDSAGARIRRQWPDAALRSQRAAAQKFRRGLLCQSNRNSSPFGTRRPKVANLKREATATRPARQATDLVSLAIDEVALRVKMVVKRGMDLDEFLQRRPDQSHCGRHHRYFSSRGIEARAKAKLGRKHLRRDFPSGR